MPFIPGESYTRDHIHEILGGEKVSYLPQKDGKIVCGCFSTDANPEAPYVILVGGDEDGEEHPVEKKAKILEAQEEPIPVFLKRASNDWMYEGNFQVQRVTRDRQFLEEKQRQAGRTDVVMALILEPVESTATTYLLTWNPNNWHWDNLEDEVRVTARVVQSMIGGVAATRSESGRATDSSCCDKELSPRGSWQPGGRPRRATRDRTGMRNEETEGTPPFGSMSASSAS